MTLYDLVRNIETMGMSYPNVHTCIKNDIYKLNSMKGDVYGVFGITQNQHRYDIDEDTLYYSLTLFYIDRVPTSDTDEEYRLQVQSSACAFLAQLIRAIAAKHTVSASSTIQPFRQKFSDECSGAYATITIGIQDTGCDDFEFEEGGDYDNC